MSRSLFQQQLYYRRHNELAQELEKTTNMSREQYVSINHELSNLFDQYDCYKRYIVCVIGVFDEKESKEGN